jgi:hypothetical protein
MQPLKNNLIYKPLTHEQIELVDLSKKFLSRALNSPFYLLFHKPNLQHFLLEDSDGYKTDFLKSLVKQRENGFPKELHGSDILSPRKRPKLSRKISELQGITSEDPNPSSPAPLEFPSESEHEQEEEENELETKGLWEDGADDEESSDSEAML